MKPIFSVLSLALLAACSNQAWITSTDESVTFRGTEYDLYTETVTRNAEMWGPDVVDRRTLVYVDSRYLRCDGDCLGAVEAAKGN